MSRLRPLQRFLALYARGPWWYLAGADHFFQDRVGWSVLSTYSPHIVSSKKYCGGIDNIRVLILCLVGREDRRNQENTSWPAIRSGEISRSKVLLCWVLAGLENCHGMDGMVYWASSCELVGMARTRGPVVYTVRPAMARRIRDRIMNGTAVIEG